MRRSIGFAAAALGLLAASPSFAFSYEPMPTTEDGRAKYVDPDDLNTVSGGYGRSSGPTFTFGTGGTSTARYGSAFGAEGYPSVQNWSSSRDQSVAPWRSSDPEAMSGFVLNRGGR